MHALMPIAEIVYHSAWSGLLGFFGGLFLVTTIGEWQVNRSSPNFFAWATLSLLCTIGASAIIWLPSLITLEPAVWRGTAAITLVAWLFLPIIALINQLDPRSYRRTHQAA